jgi:hypothetical protein
MLTLSSNETIDYLAQTSQFSESPVRSTFTAGELETVKLPSASQNRSATLIFDGLAQTNETDAIQWANWHELDTAMSYSRKSDDLPSLGCPSLASNSSSSTTPSLRSSLPGSSNSNGRVTIDPYQSFDTLQPAQNAAIFNPGQTLHLRSQTENLPPSHKKSASEAQLTEPHAIFFKSGTDRHPGGYYNTVGIQQLSDLSEEKNHSDAITQVQNYNAPIALPLLLIPEETFTPGLSHTQNNSPWSSPASDSVFSSVHSRAGSNSSSSDYNDLYFSTRSRSSSTSGPDCEASPRPMGPAGPYDLRTSPFKTLSRSNSGKFLDVPNPSRKAALSKALQKANTAVLCDNAGNFEGATQAYSEACIFLQQFILNPGNEDRQRLEKIVSSSAIFKCVMANFIKLNTYTSRIAELTKPAQQVQDCGKALPANSALKPVKNNSEIVLDMTSTPDYEKKKGLKHNEARPKETIRSHIRYVTSHYLRLFESLILPV